MTDDVLFQAIEDRVSTRTFDRQGLNSEELDGIEAAVQRGMEESAASPFGHKVRLVFYKGEINSGSVKLGTYGFVSGMAGFVVAAVEKGPGAMEDAGYCVEKVVLEATSLGLETCWIGGVFSRGKAGEAIGLRENETVPVVVAVGRAARRRSILDRVVTGAARARQRKPFSELFFGVEKCDASAADSWKTVLEAVRAAPSASNKQPWRIVYGGENQEWLFYMAEDKAYNNALGDVHLQNLDIGIAMRHFQVACSKFGISGSWRKPELGAFSAPEKSWVPVAVWARRGVAD